jgi:hypothetical protein
MTHHPALVWLIWLSAICGIGMIYLYMWRYVAHALRLW